MQVREMLAVAERRGWDPVLYVDRGVSGAKASRPELDRLMRDVKRGEVSTVACWRFDRFARSTRQLVLALDEFRALDVGFVSVTESIDTTTPLGRAMFTIIAALAEFERELIRERVRAGIATAKARGVHIGRKPAVVDIEQAERLLKQAGSTLAGVAKALGVGRSTLARELRKARQEAGA